MGIFRYEKNRIRSHDTWVSIFGSLLPATILPILSQDFDLLSFNRFTIPLNFNGGEQLSSKRLFYSDFTSYDQPGSR
jgi:hypothetical protein